VSKHITIDPITRLEGHGKIDIFLDEKGSVERAYFQVPEFRGFEKFSEGRACEEMPTLTQKICGVCPTAHHIASSKTLDALFNVNPPEAAKKIRELMFNAFMFEDHMLHFYVLGGPDFVVGPDAPKAERNILGVIGKVGVDIGKKVIDMRNRVRGVNATISGSSLYPVCGLPGGISKPLTAEDITSINEIIVPGLVKVSTIDEKGVSGVEEYSGTFLQQLITGLLCPPEALGMGKGSTEATASVRQMLYERMIRTFQFRIANMVRQEVINKILLKNGFEANIVKMKFNSVTDADEAVKAKWLGDLLRGYDPKRGEEKPFTIDEVRAMFGYGPKETGHKEEVPSEQTEEPNVEEEEENENREEPSQPDNPV